MVPPPARALSRADLRTHSVADLLHTLRDALPAELAERLRAGAAPTETNAPPRLATGIVALDALLGGGLPRGRVTEITGPLSSGRTALALALVATATRAGEIAALVDAADAFDPRSAAAAGVDLSRVLWARPSRPREALRCAERLLEARGFGVVVLDHDAFDARVADSIWMRLARSATASGTTLLSLASSLRAGPFASLRLEARATHVRFATPDWLEGLDARVVPVRNRLGATANGVRLEWKVV